MRNPIETMLRPLIRLLLRTGVAYAEFATLSRKLYVEIAEQEFRIEGRKQSDSRIAVLTGISRREVRKILNDPRGKVEESTEHNRAARVCSGWLRDSAFLNEDNTPKPLSTAATGDGTFEHLVRRHSGDMPVRAVLDELLRVGAIERVDREHVLIRAQGYVPAAGSGEVISVASQSVADLITTIDYNDQPQHGGNHLQLTLNYDNVTHEGARHFKGLSREKSHELLRFLDRELSAYDRDANPDVTGSGKVRTGLSIFYFEEQLRSDGEVDE